MAGCLPLGVPAALLVGAAAVLALLGLLALLSAASAHLQRMLPLVHAGDESVHWTLLLPPGTGVAPAAALRRSV